MAPRFDYFVVLAEMRTGSNALEDRLNAFDAVSCWGELFNPHFITKPKCDAMFGVSRSARDANPVQLVEAMRKENATLSGFRLFGDHDPRVRAHVMEDKRCAKIILTRAPVESFVSLQIAQRTGQWWLGAAKDAKTAKIQFDPAKFDAYSEEVNARLIAVRNTLRATGQWFFEIDYNELQDDELISGLARFLGVSEDRSEPVRKSLVQNPAALQDKVRNYKAMTAHLGARAAADLETPRDFEPQRGPAVRQFALATAPSLIFLPIPCGPTDAIRTWLDRAAQDADGEVADDINQKEMRRRKRQMPGHRSFAVLRHPVLRAYSAFVSVFEEDETEETARLRAHLGALPPADSAARHQHFLKFLAFAKDALSGRAPFPPAALIASQSAILTGMARFVVPDVLLRELDLNNALPSLAEQTGGKPTSYSSDEATTLAKGLAAIYGEDTEKAARAAYQRDYMAFGFYAWRN